MGHYNFDSVINRHGTQAVKYDIFSDQTVIPLWVADMDFQAPDSVIQALKSRMEHPVFGYSFAIPELREILKDRLANLYNWHVELDDIVFMPGVMASLNHVLRVFGQADGNVLMTTPVYPPFLDSPKQNAMQANIVPLLMTENDGILHYTVDFEAFENAINEGTKVFLMCNPHNPVGRMWSHDELKRIGEICTKHGVIICSDDIHADLVYQDHIPMASISPEIAQNTITLMAPSKTFNIPSLGFSFMVVQNPELREKLVSAAHFVLPEPNLFGVVGAYGAYTGGDEWLKEVLVYLKGNRDLVTNFVRENMPQIKITHPEGTYLSWLDCRQAIQNPPPAGEGFLGGLESFFLQNCQVALNGGKQFGDEGIGFARLNFGIARSRLQEALERMASVIEKA
jgi:cystathionine beta-lyase